MRIKLLLVVFLSFTTSLSAAELIWYLAASMSVPARKVVAEYNEQSQTDKVYLITGGSGQLLSKMRLSQKGDIYSPASRLYLEKSRDLGLVKHYKPFLMQTPVFGLSTRGSEKIKTFADLTTPGVRLSVGNPKTMALGAIYLEIEKKMGSDLSTAIRKNVELEALNVTQIANYLKQGLIDAGTIFNTVALAHKITYIDIPAEYNQLAETFWIHLEYSQQTESIERFERFIDHNFEVFKAYGFKKPVLQD